MLMKIKGVIENEGEEQSERSADLFWRSAAFGRLINRSKRVAPCGKVFPLGWRFTIKTRGLRGHIMIHVGCSP